ncbi:hypothetical protein F4808DRAFT_468128, partial [Astrocystis sublimbata]
MSTPKRNRTTSAGEGHATGAKVVKTSHESDSATAGKLPHAHEVQVTVKICSDNDGREIDNIPRFLEASHDAFGGQSWSKQINGFADVGQSRVANCVAKFLRRDSIRSVFWNEMEELSEESSLLAFELFDRYGRLNREYAEHEVRKGSGVWGQELDHGDILMIEKIQVDPLWRRQGVGAKVVGAVLDKARRESRRGFAFVKPVHLTQGTVGDDEKPASDTIGEQAENLKHFFRSLGFRRVGTSAWLAFTHDEFHPARQLDKAQDWDAPVQMKGEQTTPEPIRAILSSLSDPSISGAECVSKIEEGFAVEENAPLQAYADEIGNTILHVAALGRKAEPISYIMSKVPQLAEKREERVVVAVISDSFEGFCQSDIECLAALTGTEIFDLAQLSDEDIWEVSSATDQMASRIRDGIPIRNTLRLKYGCTCGQCIGGFISPKMRFALLTQAEVQHDMLNETPGAHCSRAEWAELNDDVLRHVPRAVQQKLETNKSMRQGFINMCQHIARCLETKRLPNEATILDFCRDEVSEWPPVTSTYLERGGTVAAVAMILFDRAMTQDEWAGDGSIMDAFEDDLNQLPACRNDHEFDFVRAMCGYEEIFT